MSARDLAPEPLSFSSRLVARPGGRRDSALTPTQNARWWRLMESAITATVMLVVILAVSNSIAGADWVEDMPDLRLVGLLAAIVAGAAAVAPLPWTLALGAGLPFGGAIVLWQVLTVDSVGGQPFFFDRFEDLWFRLEDWFTQAFSAGITTDNLPFVFFVVVAVWLLTYLGAFAVLRGRSPWLLVVTLGIVLAVNVSYLDGRQWDGNFAFFVGGAALLIMRTNLVNRMRGWEREGTPFPDFISLSFLAATTVAVVLLMIPSGTLPRPDRIAALNDVWDGLTGPFDDLSDEFARLFSGIDSQRGAPVHSFGDIFVLQGDISPGERIVGRVDSPEPGLLRGATYDRYTTRGWQQTQVSPALVAEGEPIPGAATGVAAYRDRREVTARVSIERSPGVLLAFGAPVVVDRAVTVEQTDPAVARLELAQPLASGVPALADTVRAIAERQSEERLTQSETLSLIPAGYELVAVERAEDGEAITAITVRSRPAEPDVVAVRARERVRAGFTYQITGSVSDASAESLQAAGVDYPLWVRDRFLQVPSSLSAADRERLQQLALQVVQAAGVETAYDAAAALEAFLCCTALLDAAGNVILGEEGEPRLIYPFVTQIDAPPIGADAVSWFLFDNADEDGRPVGGYFDYYASALALLLRTLDIPARITTGYVLNEDNFDTRTRTYIVRGQHAYAWVEVFFPSYGWVDFDPTPTETGGEFVGISGRRTAEQRFVPFTSDIFDNDSLDFDLLERILLGLSMVGPLEFDRAASEDGFGLWLVLGPVLGVGVVLALGGGGAVAWQLSLRGLGPAERSWKATHRLARWTGLPHDAASTPAEFARGVGDAVYQRRAAALLAEHYARVRFGRKTLSPDQVSEVGDAWRVLRGRLLRRLVHLPVRPPDDTNDAPPIDRSPGA